ncbi:unnamed protein product [Pylaiella littoralis]
MEREPCAGSLHGYMAEESEGEGTAAEVGGQKDRTKRAGSGEGDDAPSPLAMYKRSMAKRPLLTKSVTAAVVAAFGEMIGSAMRPSPDLRPAPSLPNGVGAGGGAVAEVAPGLLRRTVAFAIFGLVLNGPVFHWWYGALEKAAARRRKEGEPAGNAGDVAFKVALDRLLLTPIYLAITLVSLRLLQGFSGKRTIRETRALYRGALLTNWKVWTVAQVANFKLVPVEYRPVVGNFVACWWNIYLSLLSANK